MATKPKPKKAAKKTTKPKTARTKEKDANAATARKRVADKKPRPAQGKFEGDGFPEPIPEIDAAADAYVKVRDERQALTQDEAKRKSSLLDAMKRNRLTAYRYDCRLVEIVPEGETVKVKAQKKVDADPDVDVT